MWYAIWRTTGNHVGGFIEYDADHHEPMKWETKEEAEEAMKGQMLYDAGYVEFIEL